jgi:hypothetical protein
VAFSSDGKLLASGHQDKTIRLWEIATGKELARLQGHHGWVRALAFAPDAKALASASDDNTVLIWDLTESSKAAVGLHIPVQPEDVPRLWDDLGGPDATRAFRAVQILAGAPQECLALFNEKLTKELTPEPHRLARLIAELDNNDIKVRDKASEELAQMGELAEPALRKALVEQSSMEVRLRVEMLLKKLKKPVASVTQLRDLRILETLEQMGSPKARQIIERLAERPGLDQEVKATLALKQVKAPDLECRKYGYFY